MSSSRVRSLARFALPAAAVVLLPAAVSPARDASAAAADVLLSQGKPVSTSTLETSTLSGENAVDGNLKTRWASAVSADAQWLRVDLGQAATVHRVKLNWEAAYAKKYRIEISDNGENFTPIATITNGDGGTDDLTGLSGHGRFLRFVGTERATKYGYSLWELQAYGTPDSSGDTQAPTTPSNLAAGEIGANSVALTWAAATDNVGVSGYEVFRDGKSVATSATTSYTDNGLSPDTDYTYTVRAKDAAGNASPVSSAVKVHTKPGTAGTTFVLAAAGDIAEQCTASSSSCVHPKTAKLVQSMNPAAVITMGDNQYDSENTGLTLQNFKDYYDKTWGAFKNITHPVPGNHETYDDNKPFEAYEQYFGKIATPNGKRYYSWEMGNWHFIALDSNGFVDDKDGGELKDTDQMNWIKQDLAKNTKGCVAAYYHHPRWSSGDHGDQRGSKQLWDLFAQNKVDLILNGHDHHYERFVPQDASGKANPAGPVEIIGGMGGANPYPVHSAHPTTAKLLKDTFGVLKLTMTDTTFSEQLIGLDGKVLDSSPTYPCHN
ncbi:discoidin domain-containing protein [Amycolatopsis orientalis]|uniref:discoidin domain-containing protein n=1 Tax=Amycolatopsis orientalis TaxID=31958 RepID=UPI0003A6B81D|nr:discoidin domain-containing protein [Amycolatopsis orientalis]